MQIAGDTAGGFWVAAQRTNGDLQFGRGRGAVGGALNKQGFEFRVFDVFSASLEPFLTVLEMSFQKPVKIGDTLTVRLEILEKLPKFRVRIATRVFNQRDELVVDGEAEILAPRKQQSVTLTELPAISIG